MAPEQILRRAQRSALDVYALGGILYELATGRLPFGHPQSVAELAAASYRDPIPPRALVAENARVAAGSRASLSRDSMPANGMHRPGSSRMRLANPDRIEITERGSRRRRGSCGRSRNAASAQPSSNRRPLRRAALRQPARVHRGSPSRRRKATSGCARRCATRPRRDRRNDGCRSRASPSCRRGHALR
jgi:serine/threonine protein kinase